MTMRTILRYWGSLAFALLAGCQATPPGKGFYSSPLVPGDEVRVLRVLAVPAGHARVYLQRGRVTSYAGADQYAPFCYFRLRDPRQWEQRVPPGSFRVEKVWLEQTEVNLGTPLRRVAALGADSDGILMAAWQFHLRLVAAGRPRMMLVCSGAFDAPARMAPVSLSQMRAALGDYATLEASTAPDR